MAKNKSTPLPDETEAANEHLADTASAAEMPLAPSGTTETQAPEPVIPPGHVLLAVLDTDGNETQLFTVPERGWKTSYSDESRFRFKKKAA